MYYFTVIIPHKNSPELLERAVRSVPIRDDTLVIIVDDNSNKAVIDQIIKMQWPNTKLVLTKEGKGAGYARNVGLDRAQSKWVLFLDTDDEFTPQIGAILDYCTTLDDCDLLYFGSVERNSVSGEILPRFTREIYDYANGDGEKIRFRIFAPWSKIFLREKLFTNNIRFEEIPFSNDVMFSLKADHLLTKVGYDATVGLNHYSGHSSLTKTVTVASLICRMRCNLRVIDYAKKYNITESQDAARKQFLWYAAQLKSLSKTRYYYYISLFNIKTESLKSYISNVCNKLMGRRSVLNVADNA